MLELLGDDGFDELVQAVIEDGMVIEDVVTAAVVWYLNKRLLDKSRETKEEPTSLQRRDAWDSKSEVF